VTGYETFFGLNEAPFSLAPDPRFLFTSASHSAALAQVAYALERREPLVVITGEIGTGKTLLCRTVLQRLRRQTFLSVINDPLLERDDLLKQLLQDFGVISKDRTRQTEASRHELVETLHAFLSSLSPIQAHAVVIIDEAQHLQPDVLEQIRLLSNIDDARGTLLQMILVGQTDLEPLLARPELRQLQRVSRRFNLEPLKRDEVEQYIGHRLATARDGQPPSRAPGAMELAQELAAWTGAKPGVEFTADAIHAVSQLSGGVPRVINLLCDRSLEEAYTSKLRVVDAQLVGSAAGALGLGAPAGSPLLADPTGINRAFQSEPDRSAWTITPPELEAMEPTIHAGHDAAVEFPAAIEPDETRRRAPYLVLAGALALAAVAIFFGVRLARAPAAGGSAPPAASPAAGDSAVRPEPAPAAALPATPDSPASAEAPAPLPPTAARPADGRFDIVVASFRTDARATAVAAEIAALGLPIGRRVSDGWQQVVSGPFASRSEAEEAQQRLQRSGFAGTQIVPAVP
jgi:general secretion pathway protein A